MSNFKIGDKVQLLSGGPLMVVNQIAEGNNFYLPEGYLQTIWFDKEGHFQTGNFRESLLLSNRQL